MQNRKVVGYTEGMGHVIAPLTPTWLSFDGKRKTIDQLDHQHLSNIYYYMKYTQPEVYSSAEVQMMKDELAKRFDDILLPYKPLRKFKLEIELLSRRGYLKQKKNMDGLDVVINGEWIGEVDESMD
jgi:hypothetical protein